MKVNIELTNVHFMARENSQGKQLLSRFHYIRSRSNLLSTESPCEFATLLHDSLVEISSYKTFLTSKLVDAMSDTILHGPLIVGISPKEQLSMLFDVLELVIILGSVLAS